MKALVDTFNKEKALIGASTIINFARGRGPGAMTRVITVSTSTSSSFPQTTDQLHPSHQAQAAPSVGVVLGLCSCVLKETRPLR